MKVQHWGLAWGLAALCCAVGASAQASVLERVAGGGKLVIAYRESSVPFSYIDSQSGKPVGYALDICQRLAGAVPVLRIGFFKEYFADGFGQVLQAFDLILAHQLPPIFEKSGARSGMDSPGVQK